MSAARGPQRQVPKIVLLRRWAVLLGALSGVISLVWFASDTSGSTAQSHTAQSHTAQSHTGGDRRGSSSKISLVSTLVSWSLNAPTSRAATVTIGNKIILLGGLSSGGASTSDVFTIDPGRHSVIRSGSIAVAVHDAGGAVLGSKAVVFAGGASTTERVVQSFAHGTSATLGDLPVGRSDLAAIDVGSKAFVVGGFDGTRLTPEILATSDGAHFASVGELVQPVRYPAVAAVGGSIYVIGGALATTEGTLAGPQTSDIQQFDPSTGATRVIGHLPTVLSHAMAFVLGGRLYVVGGRSGTALSRWMWQIDPRSGRTTKVGSLLSPRSDAGVAVVRGSAYLVGGEVSGPSEPLETIELVRSVQ
jgi:hypothetical protein